MFFIKKTQEQKNEIQRQLALVSCEPVLRLRLNRVCSGSSFAVPSGLDKRVAFCPLSSFLSGVDYRKDDNWLGHFYDRECTPIDHPPIQVEQKLHKILSENEAISKGFKIVSGPSSFRCLETGLWGVRVEIQARKKLSLSKFPADPNLSGLKLHESALESFFAPISKAGGFDLSPSAVDKDIQDCFCLYSNMNALGGLASLFERDILVRDTDIHRPVEPLLGKTRTRI